MESKYIKALDVTDFDHQLYPGDKIKIYGKETTITGFSAQYNDGLGKWETIIHTIGRGDPFERTLSDIEVPEEQPRSYEQRMLKPQPGAVWVKAKDRLPGWKKRVKWRDGNNHSYATDGEISLFEMEKPNLEGWEWLDESAATFNPELLQVMQDAEKSKEEDLKAVKEVIGGAAAAAGISQDAHEKEVMMQAFDKVRQIFVGRQWIMEGRGSYPYNDDRYQQEVRYMYDEFDQVVKDTWANIKSKSADYRKAIIAEYLESAAGREEAVEFGFAKWATSNHWRWIEGLQVWKNPMQDVDQVTTVKLYELFKQQKEK